MEQHLQTVAPNVYPKAGATEGDGLDDGSNSECQLDQQEEDIESQSPGRSSAHQCDESASSASDPEDDDESPVTEKRYPFRQRKTKLMFTYHKLCTPTMSHE